jgi:hypothetical protein
VEQIHDIGHRYTIIQYFSKPLPDRDNPSPACKTSFHIYVDGESTSCSENTLEKALIHAIAYAHLEINEARWMAIAAEKALNLKP